MDNLICVICCESDSMVRNDQSVCDTCKYTVHVSCHEQYQKFRKNIMCLICRHEIIEPIDTNSIPTNLCRLDVAGQTRSTMLSPDPNQGAS